VLYSATTFHTASVQSAVISQGLEDEHSQQVKQLKWLSQEALRWPQDPLEKTWLDTCSVMKNVGLKFNLKTTQINYIIKTQQTESYNKKQQSVELNFNFKNHAS